jgi:hypothetical protein
MGRLIWGILSTQDKPEPRVASIQRKGISFAGNNGEIVKFHTSGRLLNSGRLTEGNKIMLPSHKVQFVPCGLKPGVNNPSEIRNFCTYVDGCQKDLHERLNSSIDIIGMQQEQLMKAKEIVQKQRIKIEELSKKLSEGQVQDTGIYRETIDKLMGELKYKKEELGRVRSQMETAKEIGD